MPITTKMKVVDKNTGHDTVREVTASEDEGIRPDTNYEGVSQIKPAIEGGCIAAGNASQFSDGASACGGDERQGSGAAQPRAARHLPRLRGRRLRPEEMGIGPVFAVPKLLENAGKRVADIDLWELNEAFAVQVIYCRDRIGIPNDKLNVNGGADRGRPPLRHERRAPRRPRADRGKAPRREARGCHDVHRRRHGRGGPLRSCLNSTEHGHRQAPGNDRMPACRLIIAGCLA